MNVESYCTYRASASYSVIMCYQQPSILVNASLSATEFFTVVMSINHSTHSHGSNV